MIRSNHISQQPRETPTPAEIRERSLEIQAEWTPAEEMRRRGIHCREDGTVTREVTTTTLARLRMPAGWIEPVAGVGGNDW